jgi:hypothetical protein
LLPPVSNGASTLLVAFDGLEQCLKIAFAKGEVVFALDEFKEDRAKEIFGENLEQVSFGIAVDEDLVFANDTAVFGDLWHALKGFFVVVWMDIQGLDSAAFELIERREQVIGEQGQVLNARAFVVAKVLFDL